MRAAAIVIGALIACTLQAQGPKTASPVLEVKGRIVKVGLTPGQGMPLIEVKAESGKTWRVWLGSMRYLMEQDFSPKAGQEVVVKGFEQGEDILAATVTLPETKQTIRLRDEKGMPLWRGRGRCCGMLFRP